MNTAEDILDFLNSQRLNATEIVVRFNYTSGGDYPKRIQKMRSMAIGANIDFQEEYRKFRFKIG